MPVPSFPTLNIVVGTRCDFACRHCLIADKDRDQDLKDREVELLEKLIRSHAPRSLFFAGGEPTLYVSTINRLSSARPCPQKLAVGITTNGGFAATPASADAKLSGIRFLKHVRMSYDGFHAEFAPVSHVKNVYGVCKEKNISFRVVVAIRSPLDLGLLAELRKIGHFGVEIQPVFNIGKAKTNSAVFTYPEFDRRVLKKYCPNRDRLAYICGKGFSICCANVVFNGLKGEYIHETAEEHMRSGFYAAMHSRSFGQLLKISGMSPNSLRPEHSSECALCEHLLLGGLGGKISKEQLNA